MGMELQVVGEPERRLEQKKGRLVEALEGALGEIEDEKARLAARKLFYAGGIVFETVGFGEDKKIEGLVVAENSGIAYKLKFGGMVVSLEVDNPELDSVGHLTLSPKPRGLQDWLWSRWEKRKPKIGEDLVSPMAADEKLKLLEGLNRARLDAEKTRRAAAKAIWEALRVQDEWWVGGKKLGDLQTLGKEWGNFVDKNHLVLHPTPPPGDVVYDYRVPGGENLLASGQEDWRSRVMAAFDESLLLQDVMPNEGTTGHQVISLEGGGDFEMFPTRRGLRVFEKLRKGVVVMARGLPEEKLKQIFEDADGKPDWWGVMSQVRHGVSEGWSESLEYVSQAIPEEGDDIDREFIRRDNEARFFRFLAQVIAQKIKYGIGWRFKRTESGALKELVRLERTSESEIVRKYRL